MRYFLHEGWSASIIFYFIVHPIDLCVNIRGNTNEYVWPFHFDKASIGNVRCIFCGLSRPVGNSEGPGHIIALLVTERFQAERCLSLPTSLSFLARR